MIDNIVEYRKYLLPVKLYISEINLELIRSINRSMGTVVAIRVLKLAYPEIRIDDAREFIEKNI